MAEIRRQKNFEFFFAFGIITNFVTSLLLAIYDEKNTTERICFHYSIEDIEIILAYKVLLKFKDWYQS